MKQKITPQNITSLKKNEVFVFGSNTAGNHAGGAAKFALDNFGAITGKYFGLHGSSFAIPSLTDDFQKLNLNSFQCYVNGFLEIACAYPKKHFLVTEIGCGIAGFTHAEIAPLFKDALGVSNISLPQAFVELLIKPVIKGYKVTNSKMQCIPDGKPFQYELNRVFVHSGHISPCNTGFHYCVNLVDCFGYYTFDTNNRVFEIIDHGTPVLKEDKSCTNSIELVRELSWLEVLELCNMGKGNSGIRNAGYSNAGNSNAGNDNAGYSNAGNSNAGYSNAGNSNAGNDNAGNDNAGNRNAGYSNAGNDNAGNYNAGNRNAGYSNAGNDNAGAFNNIEKAPYYLFNKPSNWTYDDFIKSDAYRYLSGIETTLWIPDYKMSDDEKETYPYYETTRGYIKNLPYKEAFGNAWNNWSDKAKQSFKELPNFDPAIFEDITGISV